MRPILIVLAMLAALPAHAQSFRPFFDNRPQAAPDPTPPAPRLDAFDRAVLAVCGDWGSRPRRRDFRAMLDRPDLANAVMALRHAAGAAAQSGFADRLTAAWFDAGGFVHVFCGEPGPTRLGGLHYQGRYLDMQERGWGGLAAECRGSEIAPPVYTIGVAYRTRDGRVARDCRKGYVLGLDAASLLAAGFRALGHDGMCLVDLPPGISAVAVIRRGAIRTLYPDATPHCDAGAATCPCGE